MWRWIGMVMATLALAGCAVMTPSPKTEHVSLTADQVAVVQDGTRRILKDPASATFGDTHAARDQAKGFIYVCGLVNAKNSFGGYTGMKPFTGILNHSPPSFVVTGMGGTETDNFAVDVMCKRYGLVI